MRRGLSEFCSYCKFKFHVYNIKIHLFEVGNTNYPPFELRKVEIQRMTDLYKVTNLSLGTELGPLRFSMF